MLDFNDRLVLIIVNYRLLITLLDFSGRLVLIIVNYRLLITLLDFNDRLVLIIVNYRLLITLLDFNDRLVLIIVNYRLLITLLDFNDKLTFIIVNYITTLLTNWALGLVRKITSRGSLWGEFYLHILKLGYIMKQTRYRGTNMIIYVYTNKAL